MKSARLLPALILLLLLPACRREAATTDPLQPKIGQRCTVQFRRDALGAGGTLPIPPTTDNFNGGQVSLTGILQAVDADWIVLQAPRETWIPAKPSSSSNSDAFGVPPLGGVEGGECGTAAPGCDRPQPMWRGDSY